MKKTMGRTMFTLIGRSRSGCFHLRWRSPPTENVMKKDSTKEVKLIKMYTLDVESMAKVMRHSSMRQGMGVRWLTLIRAMLRGMCPFRAPTKNSLEEAKMPPLTAPKVEQATKKGISQRKEEPNSLLANVTATALEDKSSVGVRTA